MSAETSQQVKQLKTIFVTGVGRSGTTLIQSMLNAHPQVGVPPEHQMVKRYLVPAIHGKLRFSSKDEVQKKFEKDARLQEIGIEVEPILSDIPFEQGDEWIRRNAHLK